MLNIALAQEIAGLAASHKLTWCYPAHDTLRTRLARFHGQTLSPRTITRHLGALEAAGWIRRKCRHQCDSQGKWTFRSTLYVILRPCQSAIRQMAKAVAYFSGFSRRPHVANSVTPTGYNSSPGVKIDPPATAKRTPPPNWAAAARELLVR